jgi:transposase-like protein
MVNSVRDPENVMAAISMIRRVINYQTTGTVWIVAELKQAITAAEKVAEHATAAYLNR